MKQRLLKGVGAPQRGFEAPCGNRDARQGKSDTRQQSLKGMGAQQTGCEAPPQPRETLGRGRVAQDSAY